MLHMLTCPTSVDPVNDIVLIIGESHRAAPTSFTLSLEQGKILTTPAGTPASSQI